MSSCEGLLSSGQSFCMWPNSLHLKQQILSLLKGPPETLGCLVLGLLSNFPKGLLNLKCPLNSCCLPRGFGWKDLPLDGLK